MKKHTKISALLIIISLMISVCVFPVSAAIPPQRYGDIITDGSIDIMDATAIQRHIAKTEYIRTHIEAADVDSDSKITVFDATLIQKYVAQIITEFPAGIYFGVGTYFYGVTADYDSDSALVGYPVTFTAEGYMSPGPTTASLYINSELVAQTTQTREGSKSLYDLTYTFEEAGTYCVKVTLTNKWGSTDSANIGGDGYTYTYTVKEPPTDTTTPIITSVKRDSVYNNRPVFTVNAKFGTEPYQYKYTILEYPYTSDAIICETDFTDSNTLDISKELGDDFYFHVYDTHVFMVEVKDANGKIVSHEHQFCIQTYAPA